MQQVCTTVLLSCMLYKLPRRVQYIYAVVVFTSSLARHVYFDFRSLLRDTLPSGFVCVRVLLL